MSEFAPHNPLLQFATEIVARHAVLLLLVTARLAALLSFAPLTSAAAIPRGTRLLLAFALAAVLSPLVLAQTAGGDSPIGLAGHAASAVASAGAPQTSLELLIALVGEVLLGGALGIAVTMLVGAVQTAGAVLDQHTGLSLGSVLNPDFGETGISGQLLWLVLVAALLLAEPFGLHLVLVGTVLDSFQSLPPGQALSAAPLAPLLAEILQQSLLLAVQVVLPLLAVFAVVTLGSGYLGRVWPGWSYWHEAPLRPVLGGLMLIAGVALTADVVTPHVLLAVRQLASAAAPS